LLLSVWPLVVVLPEVILRLVSTTLQLAVVVVEQTLVAILDLGLPPLDFLINNELP
jgi:hypothetical protein